MLTIEQAQEIVLDTVSVMPAVRVPLLQALNRTLAEQVIATIALPSFNNSAMDGYAVISADTSGATPDVPRILKVIADLPAGAAPILEVTPGTAARIMTGAPIPAGADAVVMVENTRVSADGEVEILASVQPQENIRLAGEDIQVGQTALSPGVILGPGELGLASALGYTHVVVVRPPRIALITTGSEVIEPGEELRPGAIYNSNRVTLASRILAAGADLAECVHVADDEKAVEEALTRCMKADLILTTGGVSVGDYDFVKNALERLGEIKFWRVLMKPGKPVAFGKVAGKPLFGLPGNPVSALVTFEVLVAPALRKMAGLRHCLPSTINAKLLGDVPHKPSRREYRQALTKYTADGFVVEAVEKQGSAMLTSLVSVNSLIVIPEESKGLKAGEQVTVIYPAYRDVRP